MTSNPEKKSRNWLRWPANLFLWAVVGWIGYNLTMTLLERRELVNEINQATSMGRTNPLEAEKILNRTRTRVLAARRSAGERFLTMIGLSFPDVSSQAAGVYQALGDFDAARYDHASTIRSYSMCMVNDPKRGAPFAIDLGASCMQKENFELGYFVGDLANRNTPGRGAIYHRFFGKRRKPDWAKGNSQ